MNIALLLMSHGDFARAAIESAELIVGQQDNYATMSVFTVDNMANLQQQMREKIQNLNTEKGLLILTDIVGGTPSNLAGLLLSTIKNDKTQLVIGFNLPVLLEICMNRDLDLAQLLILLQEKELSQLIFKSEKDFIHMENNDDDLL